MYYGLVHYPDVDRALIDRIRREYDPTVDLIEPHLTVMFLVPDTVGEQELTVHIESVLEHWEPFPIRLHGFRKSSDHWLLLVLEDGNASVVKLFSDIYTGILAKFRRDDIEFIPHVSLGLFVKRPEQYDFKDPQELEFDEPSCQKAVEEAEALGMDFRCTVDRLHLVKFTDDVSRIVSSQEFLLDATA